jgi:hypothetical protein
MKFKVGRLYKDSNNELYKVIKIDYIDNYPIYAQNIYKLYLCTFTEDGLEFTQNYLELHPMSKQNTLTKLKLIRTKYNNLKQGVLNES